MNRCRKLIVNSVIKRGDVPLFCFKNQERLLMTKKFFTELLFALIFTFGTKKAERIFDTLLVELRKKSK